MIKRLFVLTLLSEFVLFCCVFGTTLIQTDDCQLPSLYGITPGLTPRKQANDTLAAMPNLQWDNQFPGGYWTNGILGNRIYITLNEVMDYSDNIVLELSTFDETPILSLRQLINSGCELTHVYRINVTGPNTVVLLLVFGRYGQIMAAVDAHTSVNLSSSVISLWFVPPKNSKYYLDNIRMRWHFDDEIAWLGYASIDDYWAAAPIQ